MKKFQNNKFKKILAIYFVGLIIASSFFGIKFPNAKTEGNGNYPAPKTGDWVIRNNTYVENETIILNGNLIIEYNGNLTLRNVKLYINCTTDWEFYINVKNGGSLFVSDWDNDKTTAHDASIITSFNKNFEYRFNVRSGATFEMKNSELSECGYNSGHRGLVIESHDVKILNSTISNCYDGIWSLRCNPIIENNTIFKCTYGIYVDYRTTYPIIKNNTLYNNSMSIYLHYNSRSIIPKMDNNTANGIPLKNIYYYNENGKTIENFVCDSGHSKGYTGRINYEGLITLYECSDVVIKKCTLSNNRYGIFISNSVATLTKNIMNNNNYGITIDYNSRATVNKINETYINGIDIKKCYYYNEDGITIENWTNDCGHSNGYKGALTAQGLITFYDCANFRVSNCTLSNNYAGVFSYNSQGVIKKNKISSGSYGIMSYYGYSPIIENNEINYPWGGIYSYQSEPTIRNNSISGSGYGILCYVKSPKIENSTIKSNTHGIYFHTNSPIVSNCTITANNRPLYLARNCYPTLVNTTCNKFNFYFNDAPSILTVKWHLSVKILNQTNEPLKNASITVKDSDDVEIYNGKTGKDGWVKWIECIEYTQNSNGKTGYTFTINASKDNESIEINKIMDKSKIVKINLIGWRKGDVIVNGVGIYQNRTIILNGNLTIENGGNLTFKNVNLIVNCLYDGQYHIEVKDGGKLFILDLDDNQNTKNDRCNITTKNNDYEFKFLVNSGAEFEMRNSELSECGYEFGKYGSAGLTINTDNVTIRNSRFYNNYMGIYLKDSKNIQLINNNLSKNEYGIYIYSSINITMKNNVLNNNNYNFGVEGIEISNYYHDIDTSNQINGKPILYYIENNDLIIDENTYGGYFGFISCYNVTIRNLTLRNNGVGILFVNTNDSYIENCDVNNNHVGIYLSYSKNITMKENIINNNKYNFGVDGTNISEYYHDINTSNSINGKPILYFIEDNNLTINEITNGGFYGFISCDNVTVMNLTLDKNQQGILFANTTNSIIENCEFNNNKNGIYFFFSNNNSISNNNISNNYNSLFLGNSSNNQIINNNISINENSIFLRNSSNNKIVNNKISNNKNGIYLKSSSNNTIVNNRISNNQKGFYFKSSNNNTITNTTVSDNDYGIYFCDSIENNILNSTIINSDNFDFYLDSNSNITTINITFNKTKVNFHDELSKLTVKWHLKIIVVNETASPIENANVTIKDKHKELIYTNFTDKFGLIPKIICKEYEQNKTSKIYFTPHIIRAKKEYGNQTIIEINESKNITLVLRTLSEFFISNISFSNNIPNQGEIIKINATVKNTGERNATYVKVLFFDEKYLIKENIIAIDGNNFTNTSVDWIARGGKHEIKVIVDIDDEIFEYNETNNTLKRIIFGKEWIVNKTEIYKDEIINLYGNLTVGDGGNLTFKNVTLIFNCREDGDYHIEVKEGGELFILKSVTRKMDLDLIIGRGDGYLVYYENIGTIRKPEWKRRYSKFPGVSVEVQSVPTFADLDDDGDFDLTIGATDGKLYYFKNIGNAKKSEWIEDNTMFSGIDVGYLSAPTFTDLDNDRDFDLIIGEDDGNLNYYKNTGTPLQPIWIEENTMFSGVSVGEDSAPTFVDLDKDKDFDLVIGKDNGKINYYENIGNVTEPMWKKENTLFSNIDVGRRSKPTFGDLDNDGDFDLLIGEADGKIFYYENTGTPEKPQWSENSTIFLEVDDVGYYSAPVFADLDYDGSNFTNGSKIISNNENSYQFKVNKGTKLEIKNSEIQGCGYNSILESESLFIKAENTTIIDSKFTNNYNGIILLSKNNTLINNTISLNTNCGLILQNSTNNEIIDNKISINNNGIMLFNASNNNIDNNQIYNNIDGISISQTSIENIINNNKILNNGNGITISDSDKNTFEKNQIIDNDNGIVISSSTDINLINCTINSKTYELDITESYVTSLGSTFNKENVNIQSSIFYVNWYLHLKVLKRNSNIANISIKDKMEDEIYYKKTFTNQWNKWIICKEYQEYQNGRIYFTPHKILITKKDVFLNQYQINMSSNKKFTVNWPDYAVYLEVVENGKTVLPEKSQNYKIIVENWGDKEDKIYLSLSSPDSWITYLNKTNFILDFDSNGVANLTVQPPKDAFENSDIKIKATSFGNFTRTFETNVLTQIGKISSINLPINKIQKNAAPKEKIYYDFEIENIGNCDVELFVEINESLSDNIENWTISKSTDLELLKIERGKSGKVTIEMKSPSNAGAFEVKKIIFDLKSKDSNLTLGRISTVTQVNQIHEIELLIKNRTRNALPGEQVNYEIKITNNGNGKDTIYLDYYGENRHWATSEWNFGHITLERDGTATVNLSVVPPKNAKFGESANIIINATYSEKKIKTIVKQKYSAVIEVDRDTFNIDPDNEISIDFTINNTGNGWDTFIFSFNRSASKNSDKWEVKNISSDERIISQGNFFVENIIIKSPEFASMDEEVILVYEVTSLNSSQVISTKNITINVNKVYNLSLQADKSKAEVFAGKSIEYNFTLNNLGNDKDSIKLEIFGENKNWGILSNTTLILNKNSSKNLTLLVNIPINAIKGDMAIISVIAISKNGEISNVLKFTTIINSTENKLPNGIFKIKKNGKEVTKVRVGEKITFDATYSFDEDGEIIEYRWDFGNGVVIYGKIANYTYPKDTKPGKYTITLRITDNNGTATEEKTIIQVLGEEEKVDYGFYIMFVSLFIVGAVVIIMLGMVVKTLKGLLGK